LSTEASETRNGSPVDPLAGIIEQLEVELAPISARKAQLEAEIGDLIKQEQRIKAGITALKTGAPRRPSAPASARDSHAWVPAQKTQDDIYAVLATSGEPLTISQISEKASVSSTTVKKAIEHLRSEQRIRLCGAAPTPGAPKLYGTMQ
jgi:HTH domain